MLFKQNKNRNKNSKKRKGSSPLTHTWSCHTPGSCCSAQNLLFL